MHFDLLLVVLVVGVGVDAVAVLGPVHGDALHVLVVPGPGPRPPLGPRCPRGHGHGAPRPRLGAPPADGEAPGVISLPPDNLRQDSPPCIDEPVAHLNHR